MYLRRHRERFSPLSGSNRDVRATCQVRVHGAILTLGIDYCGRSVELLVARILWGPGAFTLSQRHGCRPTLQIRRQEWRIWQTTFTAKCQPIYSLKKSSNERHTQ